MTSFKPPSHQAGGFFHLSSSPWKHILVGIFFRSPPQKKIGKVPPFQHRFCSQHPLIPNHPIHPLIFGLSRCIVASKTYHLCLVAEAFSTLTLQESFLMAGTNERRDFPAINDSETCKIPVQRPL